MAPARPITITCAEMREQGVRGILIYCADYHWRDQRRLLAR